MPSSNEARTFNWLEIISLSFTLISSLIIGRGQQVTPPPFKQHSLEIATIQEMNLGTRAQATVTRLFGSVVEPAGDRNPFYVTGDFNDDRQQDLLVLVRVKGALDKLPKEVSVLNPWGRRSQSSDRTPSYALAVVHGSSEGWETQTPVGLFLLVNSEFFSTPIWASSKGAPIWLMRKRTKVPARGVPLPRMAKGDGVGLGTEAGIDITLYWNGKTYRIHEPQEEP